MECKPCKVETLRKERKESNSHIAQNVMLGCGVTSIVLLACMLIISVGIYRWLSTDANELQELRQQNQFYRESVSGRLTALELKTFDGSMSDATTKD